MSDLAGRLDAAITARAQQGARRAGLFAVSTLLVIVAIAFLTVALWLVIAEAQSAKVAALILGALYLTAGGVLRLLAKPARPPHVATPHKDAAHPAAPHASPYPALAEAFVFGLDTAMRLRRSRRDR
ncbi:MAG: phage holin family protein [Rhodobacterales bacterium]